MLFEGGPVQPESAICLARMRTGAEQGRRVPPGVGRRSARSTCPATRTALRETVTGIRVFAGYSGWSPGQLEDEIGGGSWFVFDALPGDAFVPRPDDLWPMVLRRQGGIMAAVAHFPPDATLN